MNSHTSIKGGQGSLLGISWHDSQWIPILNPSNILDYFSERSNPFYDKTCNNEIIKMQRLNPSHLNNMEGVEYILLHVQEPILYVIRKQHRHGNGQVTPLSDYYCIAGTVYQAPDLASVVNSRLMNAINCLQSAFTECLSYTRYHPSKGYSWDFGSRDVEEKKGKNEEKAKVEPSSLFQRQRVDMLLMELAKKFPPRTVPPASSTTSTEQTTSISKSGGTEDGKDGKENNSTIKQENLNQNSQRIKPPPEKKPRLM